MADLIDKLGSKSKPTVTSSGEVITNVPKIQVTSSEDLISKAAAVKSTVESFEEVKPVNTESQSPVASSQVEPTTSETVKDPDSWTKDSALKEIKRLREENKTYRVKYEEKLDSIKAETDKRVSAKEQELQELAKAKKELEEIKSKEADKERNLSEKLANREALLAELKARIEANDKVYGEKISSLQLELNKHQATIEAQNEVYKQRLQQEVESIPEKFKDIADLIVKGAGDSRDAFTAITEAKLRGVFEDKTVVVNHSVPGAAQGARSSKEKLEAIEKEDRQKMTSSQKIKAALNSIRSGSSNTAYRANR